MTGVMVVQPSTGKPDSPFNRHDRFNPNNDNGETVMSNDTRRTEGVKLVGRKGGEYYFVDSIFDHGNGYGNGLAGATGTVCIPISDDQADELLDPNNMTERYGDYWEEYYGSKVQEDCPNCKGCIDDEGCEECDYPSLRSFCSDIAQCDGIDSMIDFPGQEYVDALTAIGQDAEYADCSGCGRIFGNCGRSGSMSPDYFEEVYDRKALIALLAYEDKAVSYEYAARAVFG